MQNGAAISKTTTRDEAKEALRACRGHFVGAGIFSLAINLLFLTYPVYMLQVYDRVLASGNMMTLTMLTAAAVLALAVMGALDFLRARLFIRASVRLDRILYGRVLAALVGRGMSADSGGRGQLVQDLDIFRQVMTGNGINALFDVPWAPIYLLVLFALHPVLGVVGVAGSTVLLAMAALNKLVTERSLNDANALALDNYDSIDAGMRNAEVVRALGMLPGLERKWLTQRRSMIESQTRAGARGALLAGSTKSVRFLLQIAVLGAGSYLAVQQAITPGAMIAGMILLGRAIVPVDQLLGSWKQLVAGRGAYRRVQGLLDAFPAVPSSMTLPIPEGRLQVERLVYTPGGGTKPVIKGVGFVLEPGESLGIIGPSASGKSTLARLLVGVSEPLSGVVRLDGADVYAWDHAELGPHIGYLPQDIELFAGTVRDNIARFGDADDDAVVRAAQAAGVHDMILRLPDGYETEIGKGGAVLSTGQRQRIGLARALFGEPRFVVLDEPNASLDGEGEAFLAEALVRLKQLGTTVVVIAHRPSILRTVDKVLVLKDGAVEIFGDRDEVLAKTTRGVVRPVRFSGNQAPQRPRTAEVTS